MDLSGEDPIPEESPLNLVLYMYAMYLRIFVYSSNILIVDFDPMARMGSMMDYGTWENLRFFLRSCSLREREQNLPTLLTILGIAALTLGPEEVLRIGSLTPFWLGLV